MLLLWYIAEWCRYHCILIASLWVILRLRHPTLTHHAAIRLRVTGRDFLPRRKVVIGQISQQSTLAFATRQLRPSNHTQFLISPLSWYCWCSRAPRIRSQIEHYSPSIPLSSFTLGTDSQVLVRFKGWKERAKKDNRELDLNLKITTFPLSVPAIFRHWEEFIFTLLWFSANNGFRN